MITILKKDIQDFLVAQITIIITQTQQQINHPLIQYYLYPIDPDPATAVKTYLIKLLEINEQYPLQSKNELALLFSKSMILYTRLIHKIPFLKSMVESINSRTIKYFKEKILEFKQRECPAPKYQISQDCNNCICYLLSKVKYREIKSAIIQCIMCRNSFHTICMRYRLENKLFVCPFCVIKNIDPLHQVSEVLCCIPFETRKMMSEQSQTLVCQLKNELAQSQFLEVRCINLDEQRQEIAWPDMGDLIINGNMVMEFKPLSIKSSIKYRKDEKFSIINPSTGNYRVTVRQHSYTLNQKKNFRISSDKMYFIGIFIVNKLNHQQLVAEYVKNKKFWINTEQMKDNIYLYAGLNMNNDVAVNSIAVSLQCQLSMDMIKTPARGNQCEHIQCFCLENFVQLMTTISPKRWQCPICKKICLDFVIDGYMQSILKSIKRKYRKRNLLNIVSQVTFDQNGELLDFIIDEKYIDPVFGTKNILYEILYFKKNQANQISSQSQQQQQQLQSQQQEQQQEQECQVLQQELFITKNQSTQTNGRAKVVNNVVKTQQGEKKNQRKHKEQSNIVIT